MSIKDKAYNLIDTVNNDELTDILNYCLRTNPSIFAAVVAQNIQDITPFFTEDDKSDLDIIDHKDFRLISPWHKEDPMVGKDLTEKELTDYILDNDEFFDAVGLDYSVVYLPTGEEMSLSEYDRRYIFPKRRTVKSSRKPIKSSNLPKEVYYIVINGAKQYFEDREKAKEMAAELGVGSVYTETDPEEIQELYEVGYIGNSRKPIKSSLYISDVIDDISDDCFNEIYQQISKKYPNLDDDELTEKIDKYITDWKYDSDSTANTKAQAKKIVIDNWDQYIDLSNVSIIDNNEAGFPADNRLDKNEQNLINQLINKYQNGVSDEKISRKLREYADKKFPFSKDENKHKQYYKELEEAYYLNPVVIDKYSDYCVGVMMNAFKGGMFPTTIDGVYDWMKWWGTPLPTRKSSKYAECILKKLKETMGDKIIKSSLEDRLVPYLEEFEEGFADTQVVAPGDEMDIPSRQETFFEIFKNDHNLTDEDINKLKNAVMDIWEATAGE